MAEQTAQERPAEENPHRTLRLALAMRGGVSLAVWIGGAIAEIDVFRRACSGEGPPEPGSRGERYREMLGRTGKYGSVEIDILAGASAGGLNAVLYGLAQSCGSILDDIARTTWIRKGGMWELLRGHGFGRVQSLLRGDEHFFAVMREALDDIVAAGNPTKPVRRLTVELAATLLSDTTETDRAHRARFSFVSTRATIASRFSTIPGSAEASTPFGTAALDRLALAARATSSFPGAFEPASVFSATSELGRSELSEHTVPTYFEPVARGLIKRGTGLGSRPTGHTAGLGVNMAAAFPYARWFPFTAEDASDEHTVQEPFYVIDGGIFDNIPIDRAITGIAQAPIAAPSERFLIYLDPEPPTQAGAETDPSHRDTALNWLPVIQRSLSLKQRAESAEDELNLVLEHNNMVLATRGRLEALASQLRRFPSEMSELITPATYAQCRIASDAARISHLLTNPWAELCQPPHLGADYIALKPKQALEIKNQVGAAYNQPGVEDILIADVVAVTDQVRVLLAWSRALEDLLQALASVDPTPGAQAQQERVVLANTISQWKVTLYRWLTVLAEAKTRSVDEVMTEPLRSDRPPIVERYPMASSLQQSWQAQASLELSDSLAEMLCEPGTENSDGLFYELLSLTTELSNNAGQPLGGIAEEALGRAHEAIVMRSRPVVEAVAQMPTPLSPSLRYWAESVYAQFYSTALSARSINELARLFALTGVPDTASIINFDRISSDEPAAVDISLLDQAAQAAHLRMWLRRMPREGEQVTRILDKSPAQLVAADAKLAGNALNRFGGFVLAAWRRNDWQWGRLDAAAALTRILDSTRTPPQRGPNHTAEVFAEALQSDTAQRAAQRQADVEFLQTSIEDDARAVGDISADGTLLTRSVGGQTLETVTPHYRFALASRIVPLIYRAVMPADSQRWPTKAAAWAYQLLLIRPIAVPIPLAADPVRAMLAMGIILLSSAMLGVSDSPRPMHVVYSLVFAILGVIIAVRVWQVQSNWRTLRKTLAPSNPRRQQWRDLLDQSDRYLYRIGSGLLALVVTSAGIGHLFQVITHWASGRSEPPANVAQPDYLTVPFEAFVAAAVLVCATQHWLHKQSSNIIAPANAVNVDGPPRLGLAAGGISVVLLIAVMLCCAVTPSTGTSLSWMGWLQAGETLQSGVTPVWFETWTAPALIAGLAVATLTTLSLYGWAETGWTALCVVLITGAATVLQSALDVWWHTTAGRPILDLLPPMVWMALLGVVVSGIPCRTVNFGDPDVRHP